MRLNRVLLLAAGIISMVFAIVFTISCSGENGKNGKNGSSCTATEQPTGYLISCTDGTGGLIKHGTNADGTVPGAANCILNGPAQGAPNSIDCDGTIIPIYGPSSGGGPVVGGGCTVKQFDRYNPFELGIVCEVPSDTIWTCSGRTFSKKEHVCTNGKSRSQDYWKNYYNCGSATSPSNTSACSGGTYPANTVINGGGVLLDITQFICGTAEIPYNPNTHFCQPSTTNPAAPAALDYIEALCGSTDYNDVSHFCFKGNNGYQDVVVRCGTGSGSLSGILRSFLFSEFCPVVRDANTVGSPTYGKLGDYSTAASVSATSAMPQLCGGKLYGDVSVDANYEIKATSFTGGEYFASSRPAGVARLLNPVITNRFYYEYGSEVCDAGVVKTKCALPTAGSDTLLFDAKTQFCRSSKDDLTKLEIAPLCFKAGATTGGTKYDDVNYFCDPATGLPSKKCAGDTDFYDESQFFCYGGRTKAPYCKDDNAAQRVYDPDLNFCSYQWTGKYVTLNGVLTPEVAEKATPFCNNTKGTTFNVGSWKWEYCVGPGATTNVDYNTVTVATGASNGVDGDGTGAPTKVLSCLLNQVPATPSAVNSVCKCYYSNSVSESVGYFMHPGTGQCTVQGTAGVPGGSAPSATCPGGATPNTTTGSCACPVDYPIWSTTVGSTGSCMSSLGCALSNAASAQEYWDYNLATPACATSCSNVGLTSVSPANGVCPKVCAASTEVADWNGTCKAGNSVSICSGNVPGAILGGSNSNECRCPSGYAINNSAAPSVCNSGTTGCAYGSLQNPSVGSAVSGDCFVGTSCPTGSTLAGSATTSGTCTCAGGTPNWINNATTPECVANPAASKVFTSYSNKAEVWDGVAAALAAAILAATASSGASVDYCATSSGNYCTAASLSTCAIDDDAAIACK